MRNWIGFAGAGLTLVLVIAACDMILGSSAVERDRSSLPSAGQGRGAESVLSMSALKDRVEISGELVQVTDEWFPEYHPKVHGDIVVFTARSDLPDLSENVVFVDLSTGERRQITQGPSAQRLQEVSGGLISFTDYSGSFSKIMIYDIEMEMTEALATGETSVQSPSMDGDLIAWVQWITMSTTSIRVKDLSTAQTWDIASGQRNWWPSLSGHHVAFERVIDGNSTVLLHDMRDGSETALLPGAVNQRRPHVDGDRVVFDAFVDGREVRDLVVYEISTGEIHHLRSDGNQSYARLSGDWVVFDDDAESISDIVMMHLPTGFTHRITEPGTIDYLSDIDGNRIVFTSDAAGKFDIWMYEFEAVIPSDDDPPADELPGVGEGLRRCELEPLPALGDPIFAISQLRETGRPRLERAEFGGAGTAIVVVSNDGGGAAWADLNGERLLTHSDINPNVICLWGVVRLEEENTIDLSVLSSPGASVALEFFTVPAEP